MEIYQPKFQSLLSFLPRASSLKSEQNAFASSPFIAASGHQEGNRALKAISTSIMAKSSTASANRREEKSIVHKRQKLNSDGDEAMEKASQRKEERMSESRTSSVRSLDVRVPPFGRLCLSSRSDRDKVRETLRLFEDVLRKLFQEQEAKPKARMRIDQITAKLLKSEGKYVNTGKPIIGKVPGVEVGDRFHYRSELMTIGLHRPSQSGIDFVLLGEKVVATSIVSFGRYDNDVENSDMMTFSGQGGNLTGGDKEPEDQKLTRGNLAMKNSIDEKNVVRVIRGDKELNPSSDGYEGLPVVTRTYTYDGLYTVERFWQEIGQHGNKVYKFELKRLSDQPGVSWKEAKRLEKPKVGVTCVVDDISEGKERFPIRAINSIDEEKPPLFKYITSLIYPDYYTSFPPKGCNCKDGCSDSRQCLCVLKNGAEIPFNSKGQILVAKFIVFECSPSCKCPPSCQNRVSQNGIKFPLEIFKTEKRGWGVRSVARIPSGSFICEYIGEILEDKEADNRTVNDEYLFDIGQNYNDESLWDGIPGHKPDGTSSSSEVEDVKFTIDAAQYGNIGRFINHSCSPNLYPQHVLYDHDDTRIPHIMLFATEDIPPLQELTYDYNYKIGQVCDKYGNVKVKYCYCGSSECSGRMNVLLILEDDVFAETDGAIYTRSGNLNNNKIS
ncbi:hypothetical protein V2J09_009981 [Rumex salicifolius]